MTNLKRQTKTPLKMNKTFEKSQRDTEREPVLYLICSVKFIDLL